MATDSGITIEEGHSFGATIAVKDEDGTALALADTVTVNATIKSDFGGSPTTYATFDGGVIDGPNGLVGIGLTAAAASTYVGLAESGSAFADSTTRDGQYGIYDVNIDETTAAQTITAVDTTNDTLTISGDYSRLAAGGAVVVVSGSTGNDGTYASIGAVYTSGTNTTEIALEEDITNATVDGTLTIARTTRLAQGTVTASREVTT